MAQSAALAAVLFSSVLVHAAPAPQKLSPFTTKTFLPDGKIYEFIDLMNAATDGEKQEYMIIVAPENDPNRGAIKVTALLTQGVIVGRDNAPLPSAPDGAAPSGFDDRPGVDAQGRRLPTGFNIGRVFVSYNPDAYDGEGAYFLAMDISAPEVYDGVSQPVAFDVDGNGSTLTQTEIVLAGTVSEAPARIASPDVYSFELDLDSDDSADIAIIITERRAVSRLGAVDIDPNGVVQIIDGVTVRRSLQFLDGTGLLGGTPKDQAHMFLDANNDGVFDYHDIGIGDDIELVIRNVKMLPGNADSPGCLRISYAADSFDDISFGGGGEDAVTINVNFPQPDVEVIKEARCAGSTEPFSHDVNATPGSQIEFRVTVRNEGNVALDLTLNDIRDCTAPAKLDFVLGSVVVSNSPPGFNTGLFINNLSAALSGTGGPSIGLGPFPALDPCMLGSGPALVFTYKMSVASVPVDSAVCNDAASDCTNGVTVTGLSTAKFDPILAPSPSPGGVDTPDGEEQACSTALCCAGVAGCNFNDTIGDVPDEFFLSGGDVAGASDTPRERAGLGDNNRVRIEIECRGINLTKEVRVLPDGRFQTAQEGVQIPAVPASIEYRYTVANLGETAEDVKLTDTTLCSDIASLSSSFPGQIALGACPICPPPTPGELSQVVPSGAPAFVSTCVINFTGAAALQAFVRADDQRTTCRAMDGPTPDPTCYRNCSRAEASAANLPPSTCAGGLITDESIATACHEVCQVAVTKQVRCLDCTTRGAVGSVRDALQATAGSCLEYTINVTNISSDTPMCRLRIADTLSGQPANMSFTGNTKFRVGQTVCNVPPGFNVNGVPFLFDPTAQCSLPALAPNQTLTITFEAAIPAGADPAVSPLNDVDVDGAAFCPASGPSFTCAGTADASVDILRSGLTCLSKDWVFLSDADADCDADGSFGAAFTSDLDLRGAVFPVRLRLRIRAQNTGETPLSVTAADADLLACVASAPGVDLAPAPAVCELGVAKPIANGGTAEWLCNINVDSADAMRALEACDGAIDGVYSNTARVTGVITAGAGPICLPSVTTVAGANACSARITVPPPCLMTVDKDVRCAGRQDSAFVEDLMALPGSRQTFRIVVNNASPFVKLPMICVADSLTCDEWLVSNSLTATIAGVDVTACLSGFVASLSTGARRCFSFDACRAAAPWIGVGEALTIRFDVQPPSTLDAASNEICRNEVRVEAYEDGCSDQPPVNLACADDVDRAQFEVRVPRLECQKLVCVDVDNDGSCETGYGINVPLPQAPFFPITIQYLYSVTNVSQVTMSEAKLCDEVLFNDIAAAGLSVGFCQLDGAPAGCSLGIPLAPLESYSRLCRVVIPTRAAWEEFAGLDQDLNVNCHTNVGQARGQTGSDGFCSANSAPEIVSRPCAATVCIPPPDLGACCRKDGTCGDTSEEDCIKSGGFFKGGATMCRGDLDDDGIDDACEDTIPTVSAWGAAILSLLLMIGGKIRFGQS